MSSYHSSVELPVPSRDQIEHSAHLIECIVDHIQQSAGVISFRDYMQHCLYEPGLGYYSAGSAKFGAVGDFVTAPEISSLFGQCLANYTGQLFKQGLEPHVLEFGAGTGKLCMDIVSRFNELGIDWLSYKILEPSPDLQSRQRTYLKDSLQQQDFIKIRWMNTLPEGFNGLVLGNEVLDAMPVNVVLKKEQWIELGVGFNEQKFQWREFTRDGVAVQNIKEIDRDIALCDDYCTELNLNFMPWCQSLYASCNMAVVLLIDYGYEQAQYYHPQRNNGTMMCFYRHRSHPDPFVYPGLQDITAYVDFDAFADAAIEAGFEVTGMMTQADFLIQNGLLGLMQQQPGDGVRQIKLSQQVKTLTLPGEMGEKFKVIVMQKCVELEVFGL